MQAYRSFDQDDHTMIGRAVRVLLVSSDGQAGPTGRKLAALGARVDAVDDIFAALSDLIDDPMGYALLAVDCERCNIGGLTDAQHAVRMLGELANRISVILVSQDCRDQRFPADRTMPVVLRAPLSAVSLKVGFEHALRERFLYQAA